MHPTIPRSVGEFMSENPLTIEPEQTLADAHRIMRGNRLRHLPVLKQGSLVGILTSRDLALIESLPDVDQDEVQVEEAMSREVYAVPPDAPLSLVASEMVDRRFGSAVVVEAGQVVGVFTMTDACRALAMILSVV